MYKVVHDLETDLVIVYDDQGDERGRCEAYELDAICAYLGVTYVELED